MSANQNEIEIICDELEKSVIHLDEILGEYDRSNLYAGFNVKETMKEAAAPSHNEMRHALYHFFRFLESYFNEEQDVEELRKVQKHVNHAVEFAIAEKFKYLLLLIAVFEVQNEKYQKTQERLLDSELCKRVREIVIWGEKTMTDGIYLYNQNERKSYYNSLGEKLAHLENYVKKWTFMRVPLVAFVEKVVAVFGALLLLASLLCSICYYIFLSYHEK